MKYSILILVLLSFSCKTKKNVTQNNNAVADTVYVENPETGELTMIITTKNANPSGDWVLQSIGSKSDPEMSRVSMHIDTKDKKVSGNDACNQYNGQLKLLSTKQIEFGPMVSTKRACIVPARHAQEFYNTLEKIKSYTSTSELLILKNEKGSNLMTLRKKQ